MALEIRKGTPDDTEKLIALLREVHQGMLFKDWFYLDSPAEIRRMQEDGTMVLWVAMDGNRLAAAFDYLIPGRNAVNYGYDLGFDETSLLRVLNMDMAAVHPEYRGRGLQRRLMERAEREIAENGEKILLCTVHPDNCFSLNNLLAQGYSIERRLPKYGSVRYLLRKDLLNKI